MHALCCGCCGLYVMYGHKVWSTHRPLPGQFPHGFLLPHSREMPTSLSRNLISSPPAWRVMVIERSTWPVSLGPGGAIPNSQPAVSGLRAALLSACSGVPGRTPRASDQPAAPAHHPHGSYTHVLAQKLQHRPGRACGARLPTHQQQRVSRAWGGPRDEVAGRGCPSVGGGG